VKTALAQETPDRCSRCALPAVLPIAYGLPSGELMEAAARGEVALGGCIVGPQHWACSACGYTWPLPPEAFANELVSSALYLVHQVPGDVDHPIEVAHKLFEAGYESHVVAAGLLHEAISSGALSGGELADEVGAPTAALVELVTERRDISDADRRGLELRARVARSGGRAAAIYAADRLATLRDIRRAPTRPSAGALATQLRNVERDVRMLSRVDSTSPFLQELEGELEATR
jgi:hypothetical protein